MIMFYDVINSVVVNKRGFRSLRIGIFKEHLKFEDIEHISSSFGQSLPNNSILFRTRWWFPRELIPV